MCPSSFRPGGFVGFSPLHNHPIQSVAVSRASQPTTCAFVGGGSSQSKENWPRTLCNEWRLDPTKQERAWPSCCVEVAGGGTLAFGDLDSCARSKDGGSLRTDTTVARGGMCCLGCLGLDSCLQCERKSLSAMGLRSSLHCCASRRGFTPWFHSQLSISPERGCLTVAP